jgi:hypothetical protein
MEELEQNIHISGQDKMSFYSFCKAHWATMVIVLLSVIVFVELAQVASVPMAIQFWGDVYISLDTAMQSTISGICRSMLTNSTGLPFEFLLWLWYRIAPYGDKYLLMLPQIFVALSVLMTGLAAKKLLGSKGGILAAILVLVNINYIQYGNELRTYSLTVFASALMLWLYFHRLEIMGREDTYSIVAYGLSIALLAYTHYCTLFVCLLFFLSDMVLIIKNKIQKRAIFSYIMAAVIFLPWFIYFLKNHTGNPWSYHNLSAKDMFYMLKWLNFDNQVVTLICIVAIIFSVVVFLRRNAISTRLRAMFICSIVIVGFIIIMYTCSAILTKYLNTGNFWVARYFLVIMPILVFVVSAFFTEIVEQIKLKGYKRAIAPTLTISAVLIFCLPHQYALLKLYPGPNQWGAYLKSAANWLYEQPDIYEYDTGVFLYRVNMSWRHYYLEELGRRPKLHYVDANDEALGSINKLYTLELWAILSKDEQLFNKLKEKFELVKYDEYLHITTWKRK